MDDLDLVLWSGKRGEREMPAYCIGMVWYAGILMVVECASLAAYFCA